MFGRGGDSDWGAAAGETCPPFSVILPAYNEESGLALTLDELHKTLHGSGCTYETIVVNDGSCDRTAEIMRDRPDIIALHHPTNQGYGAALKTGIRHAHYPIIVITDGDGTYPNDRIPELVAMIAAADMVVGARIGANVEYPTLRKIPKWFLVRFAEWIAKQRIPDLNSGLRVFRKSAVEPFFRILPDTFSFTTTITLAMLTNRYTVRYEPIDYRLRLGRSKIAPIRDTLRFVQLILRVGVYFAPMRIFMPVALVFFLSAIATLVYDVFILADLTDKTLVLFVTATQIAMFALLADMLDKRT